MADGQLDEDETAPTVLTDLSVTWGRPNSLDQPSPSTASFEVMDLAGGQGFAAQLHIGARIDVRTDATIYPDPTLEMVTDGGFELGTAAWVVKNGTAVLDGSLVHGGSKALRISPKDGSKRVTVDVLPGPLSDDPSAWNGLPRAVIGQRWEYSGWINLANQLGVMNQKVTIKPVAYFNPDGRDPLVVAGNAPQLGPNGPAGWVRTVGTFLPPDDAWMGLRIEIYPSGPAWVDVDPDVTWGSLGKTPSVVAIVGPNQVSSATDVPITLPPSVRTGDTVFCGYSSVAGTSTPKLFLEDPSWSLVKGRNTSGNNMWLVYQRTLTQDGEQTFHLITTSGQTSASMALVVRDHGPLVIGTITEGGLEPPAALPGMAAPQTGMLISLGSGRVNSTTLRAVVNSGATQIAGTPLANVNSALQWFITSDRVVAPGPAVPLSITWPPAGTRGGGGLTLFLPDPGSTTVPGSITRRNRAYNPRCDGSNGGDTTGWGSGRWFGSGGNGTHTKSFAVTGPAGTGIATAIRKAWTTAPASNGDSGLEIRRTSTSYFPVTPGEMVTASLWVRPTSSTGTKKATLLLSPFDSLVPGEGTALTGLAIPAGELTSGVWTRISGSFLIPDGAVGLRVIADIDAGNGGVWAVGDTYDATGLLVETGTQLGAFFDGDTPDVAGLSDYSWMGTPRASESAVGESTWADLSLIQLDDISMLAPEGGVAKAALVFSGRITDLDARYDLSVGGTVVKVIAADNTAELANRYVGSEPWAAGTLLARFNSIMGLSGQPIKWTVASSVAGQWVTYRDVDSQPALRLLQELSASVAGVLWSATSLVTGPMIRLDDVNARPAMKQLRKEGTYVEIYIKDPVPSAGVTVSACNLLLEPIRWHQASDDDSTEVSVIWHEQTNDPDTGVPKPTEHTYMALDPAAELATGKRRISISSQLATELGAQQTANAVLARSRTPGWRISGLRWDLNPNEFLGPEDLDVIMRVLDGTTRMGLPIIINELPPWSPLAPGTDTIAVYLEGGRFTNTGGYWTLDLLVSDAASQGQPAIPWQDLPAEWRWDDFAPDLDWAELSGVGL